MVGDGTRTHAILLGKQAFANCSAIGKGARHMVSAG